MRRLHPRAWGPLDWAVAAIFIALVTATVVCVVWVGQHAVAVRRLTSGVGDTTFYSADGRPWFRMDEQRQDVPLNQIAPELRQAVVAVEDHRFYRHPGLDPLGIARAVLENVRSDSLQGASTITQQLARTLFLTNQRTWGRKFKEAVLAITNVTDHEQWFTCAPEAAGSAAPEWRDLLSRRRLRGGPDGLQVRLAPYEVLWLTPR